MPQSSAASKIVLSAVFIVAIIAYVLWQTMSGSPAAPTPGTTTSAQSETTNPNAGTPQASGGAPTPTPVPSTAALYKDGSYTGAATDAFYGIVQVKAIIKGGRLTDVQLLQYPNDREHTIEVSNQSFPILIQEAIAAQSASVDIVSGATQTSEGFQTSLSSALAQAKA